MADMDPRQLAALVRKNAAKAARAKKDPHRKYDDTLPPPEEEDGDRKKLFKEMKKREF